MIRYHIYLTLLFLIGCMHVTAQSENSARIYQAMLQGNVTEWVEVIRDMQTKSDCSVEQQNELLSCYYGFLGFCVEQRRVDLFNLYLTQANLFLNKLTKKYPEKADLLAYRAAFIDFKIILFPIKSLLFGHKCRRLAMEAVRKNDKSIICNMIFANTLYTSNFLMVDNFEKSIVHYSKSIRLIEQSGITLKNNWMYLHLLLSLAKAQEEGKLYMDATFTYHKILKIEPSFERVKNKLYPLLIDKIMRKD